MRHLTVARPQRHYTSGELPKHGKTCRVGKYTTALVDGYLARTDATVQRIFKAQDKHRGRGSFQKQRLA